ncbi:hypothetical protein KVH02_10210 [Streptomyces olivaceus]|uniref:Uncharacterized protein n=1 Tax=Streptomyces olivaceus TaxID=47716 RepID=A0ABS7W3I4_STROV|nr:hypothetical protein [Streptomyces olivaceus]MBZ6088695.1 hypothetical protein [Streptomyces olivaceus]MBZ6095931.1 hypothetical protein [Streptomyces olivaceus]MBZ6116835.1 hypothetical protein [Streptomyces olivaceus]MBZ6151751.1 hypothetical protein [Streptomyces olivaceus]MBZ6201025.1 hypothetical protein [Streptomyces olivaceus]
MTTDSAERRTSGALAVAAQGERLAQAALTGAGRHSQQERPSVLVGTYEQPVGGGRGLRFHHGHRHRVGLL